MTNIEHKTDGASTAEKGLAILQQYEAIRPKQPDPDLVRLIARSRKLLLEEKNRTN